MERSEWNTRFTAELRKISHASTQVCLKTAQVADDFYEDGYSPEDAAAEEYSFWGK